MPGSDDEDTVELEVGTEERGDLVRSQSENVLDSVLEPSIARFSRSASMPVVVEQVTAPGDAVEDGQAGEHAEDVVGVPPPLRRSTRVSFPTKRFSPY